MTTNWQCGKCGKLYSTDEFLNLSKQKMVEIDTDAMQQHGYTAVCECGYVFHKDKWHLQFNYPIYGKAGLFSSKKEFIGQVRLSTVFLELEHFSYWYETMIFGCKNCECHYQMRYKTQDEAIANHCKLIGELALGKYTIKQEEDGSWRLNIGSQY